MNSEQNINWIDLEELPFHVEVNERDGKLFFCVWSHDQENQQVGHQVTKEYEICEVAQ
tara:strand:+ start:733 stop:906 length:174 start_codon:yes stop_codon:yes gene_type:complete